MKYLNMNVAMLLQRHPWAQDVLEWHRIDVDRVDPCLSLAAVCVVEQVQPETLLRDLRAAHPDRHGEDLTQFLAEGAPRGAEPQEVPVDPVDLDVGSWGDDGSMSWWDLAS